MGSRAKEYNSILQNNHIERKRLPKDSPFFVETSRIDSLTELPVMAYFLELAEEKLKADSSVEYAVIYYDVDRFKAYNQRNGFLQGNELLKYIARRLQVIYEDAIVARFSDDHFAVFLENKDIERRITMFYEEMKNNHTVYASEIKAGICVLGEDEMDVLKACDCARYACEDIKRNYNLAYRIYDDAMEQKLSEEQYVVEHLDEAIENGYIKVYYQPLIRAATNELCAWEALARWESPEYGLLHPDRFISVLERYHLIQKLDTYIIQRAAAHYKPSVGRHGHTVPISINLSQLDFELCDIFQVVEDACKAEGVPRGMIHIEITESVLTLDQGMLKNNLEKFRNHGYQIWLDDFGSGYSSFNVMKEYDFDVLKIDMRFLWDMETNSKSRQILVNIVRMAKEIGLRTVAEGVENESQANYMKKIGCELLQGYYYGKPMPVAECEKTLFEKGYVCEDNRLQEFYNKVGRVNLLGNRPLHGASMHGADVEEESDLPVAVLEVRQGKLRILLTNTIFRVSMAEFGYADLSDMEEVLNSRGWKRGDELWELLEESRKSGREENMDFLASGRFCNVSIEFITGNDELDVQSYCVIFRSMYAAKDQLISHSDWALEYLYQKYNRLELFSEDGTETINMYRGVTHYKRSFVDGNVHESLKQFARFNVYIPDRGKFMEFVDIQTVKERADKERKTFLEMPFRILSKTGDYSWQWCHLIPLTRDGKNYVLFGLMDINEMVARLLDQIGEQGEDQGMLPEKSRMEGLTDRVLLENVLEVLPFGIFWKDLDRRFMGANPVFLNYYGFESADRIIGKNDEDMGWHIDPEPFKKDELDVIEHGAFINNVHGYCMVNGENHEIVVNKRPLYINGKISGLIGCFTDVSNNASPAEVAAKMYTRDLQSGLLNANGLEKVIHEYVEQYRLNGKDFAAIYIKTEFQHHDLSDAYYDAVNREIILSLKKAVSEHGVLGRYGANGYVVLFSYQVKDDVCQFEENIKHVLSEISRVDKIPTKVEVTIWDAFYSEEEYIRRIFELAALHLKDD